MKHLLILCVFTLVNILANSQLQNNYLISNNYVLLSDIVPNPTNDIQIFTIDSSRHSKRVKTKKLLQILKKNGYSSYTSKYNYIQFTQKSPINTAKIAFAIKTYYLKAYKNISISAISITPRTYLYALPKQYEIVLSKTAYLNKNGILSIKTFDNKKIFFNYTIEAKLSLFVAKTQLKRGDELSLLNCRKKSIMLDKFYTMPLQNLPNNSYESKFTIRKGTVLTKRDIIGLQLIKRGENVDVNTQDGTISISFSAKADQNGRLGDTIRVINMHGKRIKAVVIGKNRAEIR